MKKVLLLFTLLASLGLNALTEKEKAIAFMKDWVTFANGKMEVYPEAREYLKTTGFCIFITS
jgi:hypothetical protein